MVVASSFDVGIGQEKYREDDRNDIPLREDQTIIKTGVLIRRGDLLESIDILAHSFGVPESAKANHERNLQ
jgi:hypothetical protein